MPRPKKTDLNENGITEKEQAFCDALLSDPSYNARQAAIKSGTPPGTAHVVAHQMKNRERVYKYLNSQKAIRSEEMGICKNYVLERLVEIDLLDVADVLNDDLEFLPLSEWPDAWRRSISAIDVVNMGEGKVNKVKWPDKVKNLEMLGKHVDVGAWKEQEGGSNVSVNIGDSLSNKLRGGSLE